MAGGQLFQVKSGSGIRAGTFIAKKKRVKWGKMTKVAPAVKNYVKKAIMKEEESKYYDTVSCVTQTTGAINTYAIVTVPYPDSSAPDYNLALAPLNFGNTDITSGTTASLYNNVPLKTMAQGDDNYANYEGDSIKVSHFKLNIEAYRSPQSFDPDVMCYIIKESEVSDRSSAATIGDLKEAIFQILTTKPDFVSLRPVDNMAFVKNWKILKQFQIKFANQPESNTVKRLSVNVKWPHKLTYDESGSPAVNLIKDRIWFVFFGNDNTANKTQLRYQTRMYYKE